VAPPTPSSARCLPTRTDEDRFVQVQVISAKKRQILLEAVFDGHGGSFASEFLAEHCMRYFREQALLDDTIALSDLIVSGMARLEYDLLRELCWREKMHGAAGSVVLTEFSENALQLVCGNVGDCDVYLLSAEEGKSQKISSTHRLSNAKERLRIEENDGFIQKDRMCQLVKFRNLSVTEKDELKAYATGVAWQGNVHDSIQCTRSFGDYKWKQKQKGIANWNVVENYVEKNSFEWKLIVDKLYNLLSCEPDISEWVVDPNVHRYCVLASDGFWDAFPDQRLSKYIFQENNFSDFSPSQLCDHLVQYAREQIPAEELHADDITAVLIDLPQRLADHKDLKKVRNLNFEFEKE